MFKSMFGGGNNKTRWQEFLKAHKGQGFTMKQLSKMYHDANPDAKIRNKRSPIDAAQNLMNARKTAISKSQKLADIRSKEAIARYRAESRALEVSGAGAGAGAGAGEHPQIQNFGEDIKRVLKVVVVPKDAPKIKLTIWS